MAADSTGFGRGSPPTLDFDMTTSAAVQTKIDAESRVQQRIFAFLTDPAVRPHVRRIDTHAASVFLEGERALKIKRAVRFPYLDYSTLDKRKAACDQEMTINRQFAPQIYRRVVPITQDSQGSLSIDGEGTPVEFAIEMARFDESGTVDLLAEAGPPDAERRCWSRLAGCRGPENPSWRGRSRLT